VALRRVGRESEAESVRFHGRRVTKVGPGSQTQTLSGCGGAPATQPATTRSPGSNPSASYSFGESENRHFLYSDPTSAGTRP
jgi:hypothetical protein